MNSNELNKSYYAIIPSNVRYDKRIRDKAKLLYGEITALCNEHGFCWATNDYFANLYGISRTTVSQLIGELIKYGYIYSEIIYKEGTKEILNRYLKIFKDPIKENFNTPIKENFKENITYNNITFNNKENNVNNKLLTLKESEKLFDIFWQHYPKKRDKGNAEKWFNKNKPTKELVELMIKQIGRFKDTEDWKKQYGKFIPYPTTWLNGKMWEDEFETDTEKEEREEQEILNGNYYGT